MEDELLSVDDFAAKIKEKYPAYKDMDNMTLVTKIVEKYPAYEGKVDLKKKDTSEPTSVEEPTVSDTKTGSLEPSKKMVGERYGTFSDTGEKNTWLEEMVGKNTVTDFFGDMWRAGKQGLAQGATIDDSIKLLAQGSSMSDESLDEFIKASKELQSVGMSDEMKSFNKIYEKEGGGILGFMKGVARNPSVVNQLFISSLASMFNPTVVSGAVAGGAVGAGTGAALGLAGGPFAPITSTAGAISGGLSGIAAGASGTLEAGLSVTEFLQDELIKKGLDFDNEGIKTVLEDDEALQRIRNKAAARGLVIAAIDGITAGVASKVGVTVGKFAKQAGRTKASGRAALAATGIEAVGGGVGEATARLATGQEMDTAEIGFEAITGTVGAPLSAARAIAGIDVKRATKEFVKPSKYKVNGSEVSREDVEQFVDTMTDEEIAKTTFEVENNDALKKEIEDRKKKALDVARILDEIPENYSAEDKSKLVDLERQREKLSSRKTKTAQDQLKLVDDKIDEINNKYAVQEPSTEEVDVQEPAPDSREVGEGDTKQVEPTEEVAPEKEPTPTEEEVQDEGAITVEDEEVVSLKPLKKHKTAFEKGELSRADKIGILTYAANKKRKGKKLTPFEQRVVDSDTEAYVDVGIRLEDRDKAFLEDKGKPSTPKKKETKPVEYDIAEGEIPDGFTVEGDVKNIREEGGKTVGTVEIAFEGNVIDQDVVLVAKKPAPKKEAPKKEVKTQEQVRTESRKSNVGIAVRSEPKLKGYKITAEDKKLADNYKKAYDKSVSEGMGEESRGTKMMLTRRKNEVDKRAEELGFKGNAFLSYIEDSEVGSVPSDLLVEKEPAPKKEAPKKEAPKKEAPKKEAPKKEAPKKVESEEKTVKSRRGDRVIQISSRKYITVEETKELISEIDKENAKLQKELRPYDLAVQKATNDAALEVSTQDERQSRKLINQKIKEFKNEYAASQLKKQGIDNPTESQISSFLKDIAVKKAKITRNRNKRIEYNNKLIAERKKPSRLKELEATSQERKSSKEKVAPPKTEKEKIYEAYEDEVKKLEAEKDLRKKEYFESIKDKVMSPLGVEIAIDNIDLEYNKLISEAKKRADDAAKKLEKAKKAASKKAKKAAPKKAEPVVDKALESEKREIESDIETYEIAIEDLKQEISNEKADLKERLAEISKRKISREEKQGLKEDARDEANGVIEGYKDDIKNEKRNLRDAQRRLKKLKEKSKKQKGPKLKSLISRELLNRQVDNARKALLKIAPTVNIIIVDDPKTYREIALDNSNGFYDPTDGNIYINASRAVKSTVAHEVFHAILLRNGMSNRKAREITKDMVDALKRSGSLPSSVIDSMEAFGNQYISHEKDAINELKLKGINNPTKSQIDKKLDEMRRDDPIFEEQIAELIGSLAGSYKQLSRPQKGIVKRFLDRLAKLFGLKKFTDTEVVDLINTISRSVVFGDVIAAEDVAILGGDKYIENPSQLLSRKQNGGFEVIYTEYEKISQYIKDGRITEPENLEKFRGNKTAITSPDDMVVGEVYFNGEKIFEGLGGLFFVTKFGDVWAAGDKATAIKLANMINRSVKANGGKGYLTLTKGTDKKLISSAAGVNSSLGIIDVLLKQNILPKSIVRDAARKVIKEFGGGNINLTGTSKQMVSSLKEFFGDKNNATFEARGTVMERIITEIGKDKRLGDLKKKNSKLTKILGGDPSKTLSSGTTSKTANSLVDLIALLAAEQITKGLDTGDIYAVIEVDGEVEYYPGTHPSYPAHIRQVNKKPPTLHLPKNRPAAKNYLIRASGKIYKTPAVSPTEYGSFYKSEDAPLRKQKDGKQISLEESNLNPEQYDLVRTDEFKNWFGDWENDPENASKIVDENGEPRVVYHGSKQVFEEFDPKKMATQTIRTQQGPGYYFTNREKEAGAYGKVMSAFMSVKNPFIIKKRGKDISVQQTIDILSKGDYKWFFDSNLEFQTGTKGKGFSREKLIKLYAEQLHKDGDKAILKNVKRAYTPESYQNLIDNVSETLGVDGVIEEVTKRTDVYVAYQPTQVKMADGSNVTFNPMSRSMRKQKSSYIDVSMLEDMTRDGMTPEYAERGSRVERFLQKYQDKYIKVRRIGKTIEKRIGKKLESVDDFDKAETLYTGRTKEQVSKLEKRFEKIIEKFASKGLTRKDVSDYLYAMHAPERNDYIFKEVDGSNIAGSGMYTDINDKNRAVQEGIITQEEADSIESAQEVIKRLKDEGKIKDLESIASDIREIQLETLDRQFKEGLITEETYENLAMTKMQLYKHYVPLKGFKDRESNFSDYLAGEGTTTVPIKGKEILRAKGRKTVAGDVLSNIMMDSQTAVIRSNKNGVLNKLLNQLLKNPDESIYKVYTEGDAAPIGDRKMTLQEMRDKTTNKGSRSGRYFKFVRVVKDGQEYFIDFVDKDITRVINMTDGEMIGTTMAKIVDATSKVTNVMRAAFTTLNPGFIPTNYIRDIQTGLMNALAETDMTIANKRKFIRNVSRNSVKALKTISQMERGKTKGVDRELAKYYREFKDNGAVAGYSYVQSEEDISKGIDALVEGKEKNKTIKEITKFVNAVNTASENSTRLAAYIEARKSGMTAEDAAYMAKNLTVNFNRSGEYNKAINTLYMFFNASVQGTVAFTKAMTTLKKEVNDDGTISRSLNYAQKVALGIVAFSALMQMINQGLSDDDEDGESFFDKIPEYEKERNLIIMNPANGKDYFKIPLPYGYNFFSNIGRLGYEVSNKKKSVAGASKDLVNSAVSAFSPISFAASEDMTGSIIKTATPTVAKPFVDLSLNENFFKGSIYKENFPGQDLPDSSLGKQNTPEVLKEITKFINRATGGSEKVKGFIDLSPETIPYIIQQYTGGVGRFAMQALKFPYNVAEGDLKPREIPIFDRLYGRTSRYGDIDTYNQRRDQVKSLEEEIKSGELKREDEVYKSAVGMSRLSKKVDKKLKEYRDKKKKIAKLPNRSRQAELIKKIEEKEDKLYDIFNREYLKYFERYSTARSPELKK